MYATHFHSNNIEKINKYKMYANKLNCIISSSSSSKDHRWTFCKVISQQVGFPRTIFDDEDEDDEDRG